MKSITNILDAARKAQNEAEKEFEQKRPYVNVPASDYRDIILAWGTANVKRENPGGTFAIDKANSALLNQLYFYTIGSPQFNGDLHKGLLFMGSFGSGKTTLARTLAEFYGALYSKEFAFLSTLELADIVKSESGLTYYAKRPLILDEVGRETESVNDYGTIRKPVNELLTLRYNAQAFTIATSNYNLGNLSERYGEYIGDRLKQMFNFIVLPGASRRK